MVFVNVFANDAVAQCRMPGYAEFASFGFDQH
jgi:hypothetical protein